MSRESTALAGQIANFASRKASALSVRAAMLAIVVVFATFLWIVTVAPALVSLALTVAVAIAWCVWLEKHSDGLGSANGSLMEWRQHVTRSHEC